MTKSQEAFESGTVEELYFKEPVMVREWDYENEIELLYSMDEEAALSMIERCHVTMNERFLLGNR
jgi:hypothetical protein